MLTTKPEMPNGALILEVLRVAGIPLTASEIARTITRLVPDRQVETRAVQVLLRDAVQWSFVRRNEFNRYSLFEPGLREFSCKNSPGVLMAEMPNGSAKDSKTSSGSGSSIECITIEDDSDTEGEEQEWEEQEWEEQEEQDREEQEREEQEREEQEGEELEQEESCSVVKLPASSSRVKCSPRKPAKKRAKNKKKQPPIKAMTKAKGKTKGKPRTRMAACPAPPPCVPAPKSPKTRCKSAKTKAVRKTTKKSAKKCAMKCRVKAEPVRKRPNRRKGNQGKTVEECTESGVSSIQTELHSEKKKDPCAGSFSLRNWLPFFWNTSPAKDICGEDDKSSGRDIDQCLSAVLATRSVGKTMEDYRSSISSHSSFCPEDPSVCMDQIPSDLMRRVREDYPRSGSELMLARSVCYSDGSF
ncbi:hypothetical protein KR009_009635 [Drosophila setifemur]|nr:hypothetical protein KR009_009635 [Drosophila setifemur]